MGRLTKETIAQLKEFVCYHRTLCDDAICRKEEGCFVNWAIEGLQELQHYKELEEQGRLIELPCAVGEEVWIGHKIYSFGESVVNVMYGSVSSIIIAMQDGFVFGRTKEEAEAKLKELEK